ncbi:MAG: urease accessory protein UreF [Betaproteobacteria bacterium]|nr:urease accessory protein UreF [Betaproteobacteria bacterium]
MTGMAEAFALLQWGDSFFPTGAASFSWGLETLRADGRLRNAQDVAGFVAGQIDQRWSTFDRPAVLAAYRANGDLDRVAAVDHEVEAGTLAREAREGGRRIGAALLKIHAELGTPGAAAYRERVQRNEAPGQMAAVQGLIGRATGLSGPVVCALSAYGVAVGIVSAALRVGLIGHMDAQRILAAQRGRADALASAATPGEESLHAYVPMTEIAMMRHETGSGRLFAN